MYYRMKPTKTMSCRRVSVISKNLRNTMCINCECGIVYALQNATNPQKLPQAWLYMPLGVWSAGSDSKPVLAIQTKGSYS